MSSSGAAQRAPIDARSLAARVLTRVLGDDAWAAALLDAEIEAHPQLDPRDRALATELVYGVLRRLAWLEARALVHAREKRWPDKVTRVEILVAAYQLLCLERVPPHAAVDHAVRAVTRARGKGLGGFTNAVLRKLAAEGRETDPPPLSVPRWLGASLERALGAGGARSFLARSAERAPIAIRVHDAASRPGWVARLEELLGPGKARAGALSELAIVLEPGGPLAALPGFGVDWAPQEEGSQVVALALGARPGDEVLDACAGRGHKSAILARAVEPGGAVDLADLHPKKLARAREDLLALGVRPRSAIAVDLSVGGGALASRYARALVDAPCTGTGTLRRRPEILLRRREEDLVALPALQSRILGSVLDRVGPGGRVVYAVCSVLPEECEDVIARALEGRADVERAPFDAPLGARLAAEAGGPPWCFRLLPHVHGTDGYFVASLLKKA